MSVRHLAFIALIALATATITDAAALPQPEAPSASLRVMSFNLRVATVFDTIHHWQFRREHVVAAVRRFGPDVLGTQECQTPHADYLKAALPDYAFFGAGRNNGKTSGEMCGVLYRTSTMQKLDGGHFWLSTTPDRAGSRSFGSWFTRMCTWVKLRQVATGEVVYVFNTHLDSNSAGARARQAEVLRGMIQKIAGGARVVVTGDFNTGEQTLPYTELVGPHAGSALSLVDSFRAVNLSRGSQEGSFHGFTGKRDGDRIDWILATSNLRPSAAAIDFDSSKNGYVSDHYPVTAVFRIGPAAVAKEPTTATAAGIAGG